jgi:hypothetical protein
MSGGYSPFSSPPVWPANTIQRPGASITTPWEKPRGFDQSAGCKMRMKILPYVARVHLVAHYSIGNFARCKPEFAR